jgi:hypothetical protein
MSLVLGAADTDINTLGCYYTGSKYALWYDGQMDEFRISSTVRSAAWIAADFYNQNNTPGFLKWGSIESVGGVNSAVFLFR